MLKIYFDDVLINEDSYTYLNNSFQLFTDSFKLGSTASNCFKLRVARTAISSHPSSVLIDDDNTEFHLVVDMIEEDRDFYIYTLTDKLVDFNFNYNAKPLIDANNENELPTYLSDIWKDMCNKAGVEYDNTYTFLNDIEVSWYDSTIQARKYLSYIAQLQSGYATILENGKQSFKPHKKASSKTIDIDTCSDFILGEKKTITRVVYDNGVVKWQFGDETGTTVYLDPTNVFITSEEIVENIYDTIVGFEFYLVDVPQCPIDSTVRAGDVITFTDGVNSYNTIAQYSTSYNGGWVGGYNLKIKTDKQVETSVIGVNETVLKIETEINRIDGSLKITSEKTDELESTTAELVLANDTFQTTVTSIQGNINTINEAMGTIESTILTQTEDKFEMWFEQTGLQNQLNEVSELANSNNTNLETYSQYIRFVSGTMEFGRSDSEVKLRIENDRIGFWTGGNESAYITNNKLYISDSTVLTRLQLGKFVSEVDSYGNVNKRWVD